MPSTLDQIQAPIAGELKRFEGFFRASMKSDAVLLDRVMDYIVKRKGKQIRPMLVFLSAGCAGQISERTFRGASLVELLHTATLVHDDVVDDAALRRGFFSVNALWKNKIAVLVGDYLLSRGLLLSIQNGDFDLLRITSEAVRQMSEGELLQMEKARKLDISEEVYFQIITQKTASLISSCCGIGAASAEANLETRELLEQFGLKVGIAFQIKDDLFDYGDEEIGKPVGIDIKEKKMTLPLIYALNQSSWNEKRRIIEIVKNKGSRRDKVKEVIDYVKAKGGLTYAQSVMEQYVEQARKLLYQLPESHYRHALNELVSYTIERNK